MFLNLSELIKSNSFYYFLFFTCINELNLIEALSIKNKFWRQFLNVK